MSRLLVAELNRLRSRRLTWVAMVLVVVAVGLLQFAVYASVRPATPRELAEGQQAYQQSVQDYNQHKDEIGASAQECVDQGSSPENCGVRPPQLSDFTRTPAPYAEITGSVVTVSMFLTAFAFLLLGASFIGAEYSSGALANWLTFVPQRGKVFAAKLLALLSTTAVVAALVSAVTVRLAAVVTRTVHQPVSGVAKLLATGGRGVVITAIAALAGFAIALLTRHTIAAAGIVLGYLFVSFVLQGFMSSVAALQKVKPYLPENNALAFLQHGYTYENYANKVTEHGMEYESITKTITFAHSATYWSVLVVLAVALTFWVFRRRDVS